LRKRDKDDTHTCILTPLMLISVTFVI